MFEVGANKGTGHGDCSAIVERTRLSHLEKNPSWAEARNEIAPNRINRAAKRDAFMRLLTGRCTGPMRNQSPGLSSVRCGAFWGRMRIRRKATNTALEQPNRLLVAGGNSLEAERYFFRP